MGVFAWFIVAFAAAVVLGVVAWFVWPAQTREDPSWAVTPSGPLEIIPSEAPPSGVATGRAHVVETIPPAPVMGGPSAEFSFATQFAQEIWGADDVPDLAGWRGPDRLGTDEMDITRGFEAIRETADEQLARLESDEWLSDLPSARRPVVRQIRRDPAKGKRPKKLPPARPDGAA